MAMLKALVVDDASFVRDLVKRTVRQRFPVIETTDAQNGRRAQSLMSRTAFDLILCDWEMPEMSGLELIHALKANPDTQHIPVLMVTGMRTEAEDLQLAFEAGALDSSVRSRTKAADSLTLAWAVSGASVRRWTRRETRRIGGT